MNALKFISLISTLFALFIGCSFLTPPKEQPVEQDQVGPWYGEKTTHVFSLTPERRIVIVIPKTVEIKTNPNTKSEGMEKTVVFCAEPPPDVAESLADTFRTLAEAQLKKSETKASAEFYRAFTSSTMSLFYRSQGVQLFRDGMYNLCQAYINGMIDKKEYAKKYHELLDEASKLIDREIPEVEQRRIDEAVNRAVKAETEAKNSSQVAEAHKEAAENAEKAVAKDRKDVEKMVQQLKEK
jgi:hypothetical protein